MARKLRRNLRIAGLGTLVAVVAVFAWAVAPALSLDPYVPEPVNFSQDVPDSERIGPREAARVERSSRAGSGIDGEEGRIRFISAPFAAPKRFDLVGFPDQETPIEVRARPEGGEWSPWVETTDGEPVWAGGADTLQLRSRDGQPRGEIAYVNVSGDATPGERALNSLRGLVNGAVVSVASIFSPADAGAEAPFDVVNREEWDPGQDCVPKEPVYGQVRAAVVHHTVNANTYTPEEGPGIVLAICRYHRYSNGWNDIGYNALVDRFGTVYSGRTGGLTNSIVGAHTAGFNSQTFGVSSIGTHTTTGMSHAAVEAMSNLLAWKLSLHGIDGLGKATLVSAGGSGNKYPSGDRVKTKEVTRHRRFNQTSCPGRAQVTKILELTQEKIASGTFTPPADSPPAGGVTPG